MSESYVTLTLNGMGSKKETARSCLRGWTGYQQGRKSPRELACSWIFSSQMAKLHNSFTKEFEEIYKSL